MQFVTIDGAKARDFDDAICVKKRGRGYTLWVAIADVAHYVPEGGAADQATAPAPSAAPFGNVGTAPGGMGGR